MRYKRILFSMIIFLSVFCLSAFSIPDLINVNDTLSKADETDTIKPTTFSEKFPKYKTPKNKSIPNFKRTAKLETLYSNIGISEVDSFVNIRKSASTDSKVLGKLYRNSAVEILNEKDDWYYVESGSVKGYVKSDFIQTKIPDKELFNKYGHLCINVMTDGLNVRSRPDTDSKKLTTVYENETYPVLSTKDDWIKIELEDDKVSGYIKKEFAEIIVDFKKAVSIEEELQLKNITGPPKAHIETSVHYGNGFTYSDSDLKLLACLIHAEAGGQSYEGKLAVANVVLNRVKSGRFPKTIRAVIYSPGQFTVARSGSLAKQLANYDHYNSIPQRLSIKAAKAALSGANIIGNRLFFHSYRAAVRKGYDKKSTSVKLDDQLFW